MDWIMLVVGLVVAVFLRIFLSLVVVLCGSVVLIAMLVVVTYLLDQL